MEAFGLDDLIGETTSDEPYHEFIRHPSMSVGLYHLPDGGVDRQTPHGEDEVYYVIAGRAQVTVGNEERPVETGDTIFVAAGVEHRFHNISADLVLLVVFAPAEYTNAAPGS